MQSWAQNLSKLTLVVPLVLWGHDTIWAGGRPALAAGVSQCLVFWLQGHVLCQPGDQINADLMSHRREISRWAVPLVPPVPAPQPSRTCNIAKFSKQHVGMISAPVSEAASLPTLTNDGANNLLLIITIQSIIYKLYYSRIEMSSFVFAL